ncbi:MAG: dTDP-4-dehydrorhamnose reductase [Chlamydiales bacterium]|nr:dTDP-4-dehydrorhamnose reductase [Chlamydiales bacterium]
MDKKLWVCGAAGMLGSHFVRTLTSRNIPYIATDRNDVDITQLTAVSEFMRTNRISHIINCAAYTDVDGAEADLKAAYVINAMGPHNLAIAARRHQARLIHISTDFVFDGRSKGIPYDEEHRCSPVGAYGASKMAGEMKVLDEFPEACIIRTSWLFGFPGKNFVNTMLRLMQEKETLRVVSDQKARPTYCQDLVEAALDIMDEEGVFHFANSEETSRHQFALAIQQQAQKLGYPLVTQRIDPISTSEYVTAAERPAYSSLCTLKIESLLGRSPRPWQEALDEYLTQHKQNSPN